MAQLLINPAEEALIDSIKDDARKQNAEGISIDTNADGTGDTGYCLKVPLPTKNFDQLVPPGSERDEKMADLLRSTYAPLVRRTVPIKYYASQNSVSPTVQLDGAGIGTLLTLTIPTSQRPSVPREIFVAADFTAYSSLGSTMLEFWIEVDGSASSRLRYYFNEGGSHRTISGKWLVTLPVRATTVALKGLRVTGGGDVVLNTDDFVALSVWG